MGYLRQKAFFIKVLEKNKRRNNIGHRYMYHATYAKASATA